MEAARGAATAPSKHPRFIGDDCALYDMHDDWLDVIAEDAGLHVTTPRPLPSMTLKDHAAAALRLRQHMDERVPRHRCAVCACMCARGEVHACNASAPKDHRVAIPNIHLLRADGPKTEATPRHGLTTAVLADTFDENDAFVEYCLWIDDTSTVPKDRRPKTDMADGTWVNVCKECMSSLKGHSGKKPSVPPRSLVRLDPGLPDMDLLTPLEALVVAPLRTNKHIIVLKGAYPNQPEDQRQKAARGHVIAFPNVHPQAIGASFPLSPDDIPEHVSVVLMTNATSRAEVERRVATAKVRTSCHVRVQTENNSPLLTNQPSTPFPGFEGARAVDSYVRSSHCVMDGEAPT